MRAECIHDFHCRFLLKTIVLHLVVQKGIDNRVIMSFPESIRNSTRKGDHLASPNDSVEGNLRRKGIDQDFLAERVKITSQMLSKPEA